MKNYWLKWWQTIKVTWVKHTAYRLNFFLQIIGPGLVFFFIKYQLWSSIYRGDQQTIIGGFTLDQMIQYHVWGFLVALIAQANGSWNLSEDIRMGRISSYLIYPFQFHEYHTASFVSFQFIQLFIATFTLALIVLTQLAPLPSLYYLIQGTLFTLFISLFWFLLQYLVGILAFWLEETWIIRVIISIVSYFLSGAIIPLDLYPKWLTHILDYTPFPYLTYYPIQIFMERPVPVFQGYFVITLWMLITIFFINFVWKRGIKMYTAAGM
jgi:ABC-2 type transport system permease protein